MKIIFFGTPQFAVAPLKALISDNFKPVLAVTQPDRPKGRSGKPVPPPVKLACLDYDISVIQPENLDRIFRQKIEKLSPDLVVVVAYGKILPPWLIELPKKGCLNLHASLLPAYRGAAPIQRVLLDGLKKTGVTVMLMDKGMDTGPILAMEEISISDQDSTGTLARKLAERGAKLLSKTVRLWTEGQIKPVLQDNRMASIAPKITKEDRLIDWSKPAHIIVNKIRALNPKPGAYTLYQGKVFKIWQAEILDGRDDRIPGEVVESQNELVVATGHKLLRLLEIQPEGRRRMSGRDFMLGHQLKAGERFGL